MKQKAKILDCASLICRIIVHCVDYSGIMTKGLTPPYQIFLLQHVLTFAHWDLMYADFSYFFIGINKANYCY